MVAMYADMLLGGDLLTAEERHRFKMMHAIQARRITLNDEITYEEGGSVSKGHSWSRETENSSSTTHSVSVEVGAETGYDDATRRTVQENAANLGAAAAEFE